MNPEETYQFLKQFSDYELFYQERYRRRDEPRRLQAFLNSLDREAALEKGLVIPEFSSERYHPSRLDDSFFNNLTKRNIFLLRHDRYLPPYVHDHAFFELVYIIEGSCENTLFDTTYTMKAGDLCLLSPDMRHSLWTTDGIVMNILLRRGTILDIFYQLFRDDNLISDFFISSLYLKDFTSCLMFQTEGDETLRELVLSMYGEQLEDDAYSESIIRSMLMIFFSRLIRGYRESAFYPQPIRRQQEAAARIMNIMLKEYPDISLNRLARLMGYSEAYCSRYIKRMTGCTFLELFKTVRFSRAEDYLLNTTISIQEISALCGYENPESFNRAFRQQYKTAPSVFRREHARKE